MRLIINDSEGLIDYKFCLWLISQIKNEYIETANVNKLLKMDEYLHSLDFMASHKDDTSYKILQKGLQSLQVSSGTDSYIIRVNDSIYYDFATGVKLSTVCKLINYGTISVQGYPIYQKLFTHFAENLGDLVKYYYTYVVRR